MAKLPLQYGNPKLWNSLLLVPLHGRVGGGGGGWLISNLHQTPWGEGGGSYYKQFTPISNLHPGSHMGTALMEGGGGGAGLGTMHVQLSTPLLA